MDAKYYEIASRCADASWARALMNEFYNSEKYESWLIQAAFGDDEDFLQNQLREFQKRNRKIVALLKDRLKNPSAYKIMDRPVDANIELNRLLAYRKYREAGHVLQERINEFSEEKLLDDLTEMCGCGTDSEGGFQNRLYFIRCLATALQQKTGGGTGFLAKPLHVAITYEFKDAALTLIKAGADVLAIDGATCFHDQQEHKGCSLLHAVAQTFSGQKDICVAVIKAGHPIDCVNDAGVPVIEYFPAEARREWADEYFAELTEKQIKKATPRSKSNLKKRSTAKSI